MGTNGVDGPGTQPVAADGRMAELEALFLGGPLMAGNMHGAKSFSIETLLDILVVLFDECSNSSLRREKTVSEFIELGKHNPGPICHIPRASKPIVRLKAMFGICAGFR